MKGLTALVILGFPRLLVSSTPLGHVHFRQLPQVQISWITSSAVVSFEATAAATGLVAPDDLGASLGQPQTPFLVAPPAVSSPPTDLMSVSVTTSTTTLLEVLTSTFYEPPETITLSASPTTVTDTITVSQSVTATPGSFWAAPAQFSDLGSFKITHFAYGEKNLQIIDSAPANASSQSLLVNLGNIGQLEFLYGKEEIANSSSSVLQLLYPADSINPGNSPQGGADFYATPLPLGDASNVTLEYSVLFPQDFDWVNGGKLPGLYGGHMTCSGGDDATSCFSTRLMWRTGGAGELYLYAPKDKQTYSLCHTPPESVCDAAYGLSVGRGSFNFAPGAWTHVRQTVSLNTPGKQDGGFSLEVDGKLTIHRNDVFYRGVPSTVSSTAPEATQTSADGGLLSPLIGKLFGPPDVDVGIPPPLEEAGNLTALSGEAPAASCDLMVARYETTTIVRPTITVASYLWAQSTNDAQELALRTSDDPKPITFTGLFFSTFFGGNSEEYATPTDQYTWFKDFAITVNS
ncbi:hypothetical protein M0805_006612 [Coniferiporia weirii]|nr:hypothetical protein M0805_006612 [Coniferiporia weirii]